MSTIELQPTAAAHWHSLVTEAEQRAQHQLGEDVESYLVFLLQRFLSKPEIGTRVLAIDYLQGLLKSGQLQHAHLREVADVSLLHAGFFPLRARRLRVSISYYVKLGQGAYYQLHHHTPHRQGDLYASLCTSFVKAMDVLQAMRTLDGEPLLDALGAHELWAQTGSTQARQQLRQHTQGSAIEGGDERRH